MQRQIGGFLVGQKHAVLAQHKGAYFFRAGHRCRIILLHLLEQKVVFAVHQFAGEEPLGKILQVAHEPRIVDALGTHRAVHTVGDNVGQLTDQLRCPHGIVAGLRVLPGVDDMEGDVACLFVRQLDAKLCLYLLQAALAHTLTVIRRRIKEHGQLVVAVEPNLGSEQMQLRAIRTADGASWWYAFTSFDEEMKGAEPVQSTFLVDMEKLFDAALAVPEISGIILNPWNRTIQLDKTLIRIIKGA